MAEKLSTEIRKEQIIEASMQIISENGLNALTIQKIAECIGVVPSNVYRHFEGKEQIIEGVLDFIKRRYSYNLSQAKKKHKESLGILRGILLNQVEMMLNVSAILPRLLLSDAVFTSTKHKKQLSRYILQGPGFLRKWHR